MLGITRLRLLYAVLWIAVFREALVAALFNDIPAKPMLDVWRPRRSRLAAIYTRDDLSCERPEYYYTCEEHQNMIPPETVGTCNYRNQNFHEQVYRWVAGRGCLLYTPDFLYVGGANPIKLSAGCLYGNQLAPCLEIAKEDGTCACYPFDPAFEEVSFVVREALLPSAHGRWEKCFYAASDCCSNFMISNNDTGSDRCPTTFDGWTCWHEAQADSKAQEVCTEFVYSGEGPSCNHYSVKQCYANSTWAIQTDYSPCSVTSRLLRRFRFYIAMLAFSVASCLPAVFVFFFYKRLRITRVALHRNLLIAIIVRNILVIISRSVIYIDELTNSGETAMSRHSVGCRALAVAERAAGNAVFVCMLVEGVFLHRLIVAVFRQKIKIKWLYGIGAVIATVPVIVWAIVMGLHDDHSCWLVYTIENVQWILDAPRVAILLINTILFGDVLRVLLTKIRNTENANQLSTAKATLFLMPIFGTQFLLTAFRPNTADCTGEQIYYYITYSVEGLQGFIVALLYCYMNKEVHSLIKATYKKTESAVISRVRGDSHFRPSLGPNSDRRITYSTDLPAEQNHQDDPKDQYYAAVRPKLHVAEIISIQASEKLADILEPVYETIENGCYNEGYDSLDRSDVDNYSDFTPNTNDQVDNYYGFTKASSVSFDCQDWIRCVSSPSSSISTHENDTNNEESVENNTKDIKKNKDGNNKDCVNINTSDPLPIELEDENMLHEILQYIETKETENVSLDPEVLSPNRKDDDKIVFVDD